jgi:HSP20 family protein
MSIFPVRRRLAEDLSRPLGSWLESFFDRPAFEQLPEVFRRPAFPPINLSENASTLTVTAELPGLDEEDLDVQVMGNQLVISGERKWEKEEKKDKEFHRVESQYGSFSRTVTLPVGLRLDKAEATYDKGMLAIRFPKVEPTPAAKIKVKKG